MSSYDLGRHELKYAVPCSMRDRIVELAAAYSTPDPHGVDLPTGGRGYVVQSLYFDTPDFRDYFERLGERRIRDRLRIRTYGAPGGKHPVFLENKRKYLDRVIKHRVKVGDADAWCGSGSAEPWTAFHGKIKPSGRFALEDFTRAMAHRIPRTIVSYQREVYIARRDDDPKIRLTMDRQVSAGLATDARQLYAPSPVALLPSDWMVMELKFDRNKPAWMRAICSELGLRAAPVSKFGLSMAHLHRPDHRREVRYLTPAPLRPGGRSLKSLARAS
jgi:hypothetical protein